MNDSVSKDDPRSTGRRTWLVGLTLLAGLGTLASSLLAWEDLQKQQKVVQLQADPAVIDLGPVLPERTYPVVFHLKNSGDFPVEIVAVRSSCTCTAARFNPTIIEPGESLELPAKFTVGRKAGAQSSRIALLYRRPKRNVFHREHLRVRADVIRGS